MAVAVDLLVVVALAVPQSLEYLHLLCSPLYSWKSDILNASISKIHTRVQV